jgi:hypothetical protein
LIAIRLLIWLLLITVCWLTRLLWRVVRRLLVGIAWLTLLITALQRCLIIGRLLRRCHWRMLLIIGWGLAGILVRLLIIRLWILLVIGVLVVAALRMAQLPTAVAKRRGIIVRRGDAFRRNHSRLLRLLRLCSVTISLLVTRRHWLVWFG